MNDALFVFRFYFFLWTFGFVAIFFTGLFLNQGWVTSHSFGGKDIWKIRGYQYRSQRLMRLYRRNVNKIYYFYTTCVWQVWNVAEDVKEFELCGESSSFVYLHIWRGLYSKLSCLCFHSCSVRTLANNGGEVTHYWAFWKLVQEAWGKLGPNGALCFETPSSFKLAPWTFTRREKPVQPDWLVFQFTHVRTFLMPVLMPVLICSLWLWTVPFSVSIIS